jgi:hypothetical protein
MESRLHRGNFSAWFDARREFIESRHACYAQEILRIKRLTEQAQAQDVRALVQYLRPWNIETEGNWIGREWLRTIAMQALCYLGSSDQKIKKLLESISSSNSPEWREFDNSLRDSWHALTDASCLADPYEDFLRCIGEVVECIASLAKAAC